MKKVYCKDCLNYGWRDNALIDFCVYKKEKNYFGYDLGIPCMEMNRNLNCKHFKVKWWKFWI